MKEVQFSFFFIQSGERHINTIFNTDNGTIYFIIFRLTVSGFLSIRHLRGVQSLCYNLESCIIIEFIDFPDIV
jgi:hypothetical protein